MCKGVIMKFNFLAFGFCIGLAFVSFVDNEVAKGLIQLLCACINIPFMCHTR